MWNESLLISTKMHIATDLKWLSSIWHFPKLSAFERIPHYWTSLLPGSPTQYRTVPSSGRGRGGKLTTHSNLDKSSHVCLGTDTQGFECRRKDMSSRSKSLCSHNWHLLLIKKTESQGLKSLSLLFYLFVCLCLFRKLEGQKIES